MEGRRIGGEGLDHEQEYIRERIEETAGGDDLATATEKLEDELRDLRQLSSGGHQSQEPAMDLLQQEATMPADRMEARQGDSLDPGRGGIVDPQQQPPDAEARAGSVRRMGGGAMGSS